MGRSGHTAGVPVPAAELMLRRFLENTLYARPREKEFIIGHPAFMLATFAFLRKWPLVIHKFYINYCWCHWYCFYGRDILCHLRTPVMMSIMRGVDGLRDWCYSWCRCYLSSPLLNLCGTMVPTTGG